MPHTCQGVVFDLDGTLIDSLEEIATAANRILGEAGLPTHPTSAYKHFVGNGSRILMERAAPPEVVANPDTFNALLKRFLSFYHGLSGTIARPYEGIPELLTALTDRGITLYVLSNKPHEATRGCVEALLPHWPFQLVLGARESVPVKPDPTGALEIIGTSGIPGPAMLYLGDTAVDMVTALGAGMVPVGVLWGFREKEELVKSGARHIIAHPLELLPLLEI